MSTHKCTHVPAIDPKRSPVALVVSVEAGSTRTIDCARFSDSAVDTPHNLWRRRAFLTSLPGNGRPFKKLLQEESALQTNWFIVFEAKGAWWIDNEGTEFGPFASKETAGSEAIVIARRFGDKNRRSRIYWPDEQGKQQLIWEGI